MSEEDYSCLGDELYSDFLSCNLFSLKCKGDVKVKGIQIKSNSIYDTISVRNFQQHCIYRFNKKSRRNIHDICTKEIAYLFAVATKCIWMLVQHKFLSFGSAETKITQDLLIPLLNRHSIATNPRWSYERKKYIIIISPSEDTVVFPPDSRKPTEVLDYTLMPSVEELGFGSMI